MDEKVFYKRCFDETQLICLNKEETKTTMKEVYEEICAIHANRHMMAWRIQRSGYF